jgi:hypothetical protein
MVVVAGPRIDPASLPSCRELEMHRYIHELYRHLAVRPGDRAGRADHMHGADGDPATVHLRPATPPLRADFHVADRLRRHGSGRRIDYDDLTPDLLVDVIATEISRKVSYRPVPADGAARAAGLLAELLPLVGDHQRVWPPPEWAALVYL